VSARKKCDKNHFEKKSDNSLADFKWCMKKNVKHVKNGSSKKEN
jgi:hypothetical protein